MKSSGDVRNQIAALLREDLPRRSTKVRQVKGLSAREVPDKAEVFSGPAPDNAFGGGSQPVWIAVTNPRHVPPMRLVDWSGGEPVYEIRYACQIEVWTLGQDWENAIRTSDEVEAMIRASLIQYANLSTDAAADTGYAVHPPTAMTQFGRPMRAPNQSGRSWAPSLISVDIRTEEPIADSSPEPEPELAAIELHYVGVPTDEPMPDLDTADGRIKIKEWTYGSTRIEPQGQ